MATKKNFFSNKLLIVSICMILLVVSFLLGTLFGEKKQIMKQFALKTFTAKQFDKDLVTFQYPPSLTAIDPNTKKESIEGLFLVDNPSLQSPVVEITGLDPTNDNNWENLHFSNLEKKLPYCVDSQVSVQKYLCIEQGLIPGSNNDPIELKISGMIPNSVVQEVCILDTTSYGSCYLSVKSPTKNFAIRMVNDPLVMCNYHPKESPIYLSPYEQILNTITQ